MSNVYRSDGWVKTSLGPAVPGAQIYVCTQPANTVAPIDPKTNLPVKGWAPSPLASIFSDSNGLMKITQPILTDGFGHYDFYTTSGLYTLIVSFGGRVQQVYPDQSVGNVGSGGIVSPIVFSTNGTPNFNQLLQNLVQGVGITLVTDNLGNTTITGSNPAPVTLPVFKTNGVTNSDQTQLNLVAGADISLSEVAGSVTIADTRAKTATITFSVPLWTNASGNWRESPGLPWTVGTASEGASTQAFVQPTVTAPGYVLLQQLSANNNSNVEFIGAVKGQYLGQTKTFQINAAVFGTNNLRYWIGLTSLTSVNGAQMESLNPNANIAGFRYSFGADPHWVAYVSTDNTHFSTHDTGVAVDITGAFHVYEIRTAQGIPGTVYFYIDGVACGNLSANVPTATTALTPLAYSESLFTPTDTGIGCNLFYSENFQ